MPTILPPSLPGGHGWFCSPKDAPPGEDETALHGIPAFAGAGNGSSEYSIPHPKLLNAAE